MAMLDFQQALCELIASPALCLSVRENPDGFLGRYDLSPRERQRLLDVVRQRGMSTTCSLYRSNRITPLYTLLHHTCVALGERLQPLLDQYWAAAELRDLEFKHEIERFGHFLKQRLEARATGDSYVREILEFELAVNELRFAPRRTLPPFPQRVVRFDHDPSEVLTALTHGVVPQGLAERESYLVLRAMDGELTVEHVDADAARSMYGSLAVQRDDGSSDAAGGMMFTP